MVPMVVLTENYSHKIPANVRRLFLKFLFLVSVFGELKYQKIPRMFKRSLRVSLPLYSASVQVFCITKAGIYFSTYAPDGLDGFNTRHTFITNRFFSLGDRVYQYSIFNIFSIIKHYFCLVFFFIEREFLQRKSIEFFYFWNRNR